MLKKSTFVEGWLLFFSPVNNKRFQIKDSSFMLEEIFDCTWCEDMLGESES